MPYKHLLKHHKPAAHPALWMALAGPALLLAQFYLASLADCAACSFAAPLAALSGLLAYTLIFVAGASWLYRRQDARERS